MYFNERGKQPDTTLNFQILHRKLLFNSFLSKTTRAPGEWRERYTTEKWTEIIEGLTEKKKKTFWKFLVFFQPFPTL